MKIKNEFKAGILVLIAAVLLFSIIMIFAGQGIWDGSGIEERLKVLEALE